jgi:hypothetical protein
VWRKVFAACHQALSSLPEIMKVSVAVLTPNQANNSYFYKIPKFENIVSVGEGIPLRLFLDPGAIALGQVLKSKKRLNGVP